MNELEGKARPSLEPMFHGETIILSPVAQRYVAAWVYKTILTMERAHGESKIVTPAEYRAFHRRRFPPMNAHVWLAASGEPERTSHFERFLIGENSQDDQHPLVYCATLGIKHLLMQLAFSPYGEHLAPENPAHEYTLAVWPGDGSPRRWPPTYALERARIKEFVYRFDPDQ